MKLGVIGTGNMGRILIEAMLDGNVISPEQLLIHNRGMDKALHLKEVYTNICVKSTLLDIAEESDLIFLCIKPHDILAISKQISPYIKSNKCVVSITSPITPNQLESYYSCSVIRVIPSITNRALTGVSLFSFGNNCKQEWKDNVWNIFQKISSPLEINENITRVASDIVSCGPAFFSYLSQQFIEAAVAETDIDIQTATQMTSEMLIGLGELLKKGYYTLPTLQEKVCVKGGITGEGIKILENELGDIFNHVFQATQKKYEEDLHQVKIKGATEENH